MPVHEVTIGHMLRPRLNIAPSDPIVFSPDDTCPEGDLTYIVKAQVILPIFGLQRPSVNPNTQFWNPRSNYSALPCSM